MNILNYKFQKRKLKKNHLKMKLSSDSKLEETTKGKKDENNKTEVK